LVLCWSTANRARDSISREFSELGESWIPPSGVAICSWSKSEQSPEDSRTVKIARKKSRNKKGRSEMVALIRFVCYLLRNEGSVLWFNAVVSGVMWVSAVCIGLSTCCLISKPRYVHFSKHRDSHFGCLAQPFGWFFARTL